MKGDGAREIFFHCDRNQCVNILPKFRECFMNTRNITRTAPLRRVTRSGALRQRVTDVDRQQASIAYKIWFLTKQLPHIFTDVDLSIDVVAIILGIKLQKVEAVGLRCSMHVLVRIDTQEGAFWYDAAVNRIQRDLGGTLYRVDLSLSDRMGWTLNKKDLLENRLKLSPTSCWCLGTLHMQSTRRDFSGFWIECDYCKRWCHGDCEGISTYHASSFRCKLCTEKGIVKHELDLTCDTP
jgi:hypothetical protein